MGLLFVCRENLCHSVWFGLRSAYRWVLASGPASANLVRKKSPSQVDLRLVLFPQASPPNASRNT